MPHRKFACDDRGITEVVGYILTFAISAVVLVISVQSFTVAQQNSDAVVTAVELKSLATRVSARIVEAGLVAHEFPNATFEVTVLIPQSLAGKPFYIEARPWAVYANTTDNTSSASATTFRLESVSNVAVTGLVHSSQERVVVRYEPRAIPPTIRIEG